MKRQQILTTIKQQRQLLPLLVLSAGCIDAFIAALRGTVSMAGETYDFTLSTKHYLAFGAVAINFLTYFLFRRFYKYTMTFTVAIGLFNLLIFSALETTQGFFFNGLGVNFQPVPFLAGLLAYILNFKRVNNLLLDNIGTKQTPEEQERYEREKFAEETEKFKERYKNYSNEKLTEIVIENKFVPGALEAARQLLHERQSK